MEQRAGQKGLCPSVCYDEGCHAIPGLLDHTSPHRDARAACLLRPHQRSVGSLLMFANAKVEYDISDCLNVILCVCVGVLREPS